jgi:AcrR family transcriptional regulator
MTRTNRKTRAETQKRILDAACEIVETEGFDTLSIRTLAGTLQCSVGTIYNYYKDIDTLTLHINGQTIALLDNALMAAIVPNGKLSGKPVPEALVDAYFNFLEANPNRWRALFQHYPPAKMRLPAWYTKIIDGIVSNVREALLPHLRKASRLHDRDLIIGLWAALHGLSMLDQQGKLKTVSAERSVRQIAHVTVRHALKEGKS